MRNSGYLSLRSQRLTLSIQTNRYTKAPSGSVKDHSTAFAGRRINKDGTTTSFEGGHGENFRGGSGK